MAQTKLANLINPQVMGDMITAGLPMAIKFTPIASIDTTLEGQPGNTISIPAYTYIGDAKDVPEGEAIELTQMATSLKQYTIKKAGKGVEITDEAMLSGFGDPVGQAVSQLKLSIASKIDADVIAALGTATVSKTSTGQISYTGVVDAVDMLLEENAVEKYIFIHPNQATTLRKDPNFMLKRGRKGAGASAKMIKEELEKAFTEYGIKSLKNEFISISYVEPSITKSIDLKTFQEQEPIAYAELLTDYPKFDKRKGYVRFTIPK